MPSRRAFLAALGTGAVGALAGCSGSGAVAGRWPRAGYDDRNSGFAPDVRGPTGTLAVKWQTDVPEGVYASTPVLADDRVYVGYGVQRHNDQPRRVGIRILDAGSGETRANFTVARYDGEPTSGALYRDSVVYADGSLYVQAFDGVYSLTLDGEERWRVPMGGGPVNSIQRSAHPLVVDGVVYAPTASTTWHSDAEEALYAIDDADGSEVWRYVPDAEQPWTFPPAYAGGVVYLSVLDHGVIALDAKTGDVLWQTQVPTNGTPTVANGRAFVSLEPPDGTVSHVVALDAATGEEVWRATGDGSWIGRRLTVARGRVYYRENLTDLVARDAATGEEVWRYTGAEAIDPGQPSVTNETLYVPVDFGGNDDSGIAVLDPETGEERGIASLGFDTGLTASVALADGIALVTAALGEVYAFETCPLEVAGRCIS